jgi:DUF4097 and DUF4098 domain-containing protein YvlB
MEIMYPQTLWNLTPYPAPKSRAAALARAGAALLALLALAAPAAADKPVDETRQVAGDAKISIETLSGSVKVTGWSRNEVKITGTVGDDTDGLEIRGGGDELTIEVDIPERRHRGNRDLDAHLEISVPAGARLDVESVSSSAEVSGVSGTVNAESVSGSIDVDGAPQSVQAETVSGRVRVIGSRGRVRAESVSGSIQIDGGEGEIQASTVSGTIKAEVGEIDRGRFETVSGQIRFNGALAPDGELTVEGHSGEIDIALPAGTSAAFRVETFSGDVDNRLSSDRARRTSQYAPGKELEFNLGSGDGNVEIESFSGQVTLRTP